MLESKSLSHCGSVREINEDCLVDDLENGIWVVADGVGGNGNGQVASQIAVQTIERNLRQGMKLRAAIEHANETLREAMQDNPDLEGMATTVMACRFDAGHFEISWVGDSRAYLINAQGIVQLSRDHNLANHLYENGEITEYEAEKHSGQHQLTQALGQMDLEKLPKVVGELHDQDCLLLCTDGLTGVLGDEEIYSLVHTPKSLEHVSEELLARVLEEGAPDNVSLALIRFAEDPGVTKASDFASNSYRKPFDRRPYEVHRKNLTLLLIIILVSITVLMFMV